MSGATDAPFRRQAARFGAQAVVSEMTASDQLLLSRPDIVRRTCRQEDGCPWVVQLAGRRPEDMAAAAAQLVSIGVDQIDINMGCPARKVTGGHSGSALMRDIALADEIILATIEGAKGVPVSLKMRLGWDEKSLNAPEIGYLAERHGVMMLTVHGRTRCQFYKGFADWTRIADTVNAVSIPVIANGDIVDVKSAKTALALSLADGVMVGRAALGCPWLPAQIAAGLEGSPFVEPTLETRYKSLRMQLSDSAEFYGEHLGIRITRKHISAAIAKAPLSLTSTERRQTQADLCRIDTLAALVPALQAVFLQDYGRRAA